MDAQECLGYLTVMHPVLSIVLRWRISLTIALLVLALSGFMYSDLGFIDLEQKTLQPLDNWFGPRLSPMS